MISDTCKCGAEFNVEYNGGVHKDSNEDHAHKRWLDAHKGCRERMIVPLQDNPQPYAPWWNPVSPPIWTSTIPATDMKTPRIP